MPKYKRYGYMVVKSQTSRFNVEVLEGHVGGSANVGFHHNPRKANEEVDGLVDNYTLGDTDPQMVEDTTFTEDVGMSGDVIREVLIDYPDGAQTRFTIERWFVVVGKE